MSKFFSVAKRFTALTVTAMTILWSVGIAGLVPAATQAATPGSLIKQADLPGVYYYGADGNRYTFPNATTFETWYTGFNGVQTIPATELQAIRLAGNVTFRPGTYLVKITTDPAVYAVAPGGMLHWVTTEAIALALYGPNWAKMVRDVPDQLFPNYKFGSDIKTNAYPTGSVISHGGNNYYVDGTTARKITAEGFTANNFMSKFVVPASDAIFAGLTMGTDITAADSTIWNVAGGSGSTQTDSSSVLTATLASTTPASGVLVTGQATAPLADFAFSGNGTLNSIKLKRIGISDSSTFDNVYLYDGNVRLTDGYSFNTAGEIVINNINLMVSGSKTISVRADVDTATSLSGQTIGVSLIGYAVAGGSMTTSSLVGNLMSVSNGSGILASATLAANSVAGGNINAGITQQTMWRSTLQISTRAVQLKSANFRMIGSAPSDALKNIKLYVDGIDSGKMGTVVSIDGTSYISFDLTSPLQVTTGSHTVEVRADIDKGTDRTVQLSIQQAADIMIYDPQVGVNVAVGGTIPNTTTAAFNIQKGSLTMSLDPTFSTFTNVVGGASDATLAKFKVRAYGEDVKIESLTVNTDLISVTGQNGLNDVTVFFNGSQVGTSKDFADNTPDSFSLGSQLIVPAGQDSVLEIKADVQSIVNANYSDGSILVDITAGTAIGQVSKASVTVSAVSGKTLEIQTGTLKLSKNSGYADQSLTPNTTGAKIGSYTLQNQSSSESVRVTGLQVTMGGSQTITNTTALRTSETSGSGATPLQPQAGTAANTFSVDFTLAPGATKTIDILADLGSQTGVNIITSFGVTYIGVSSNLSACVDADASCAASFGLTGQTMTLSAGTLTNPPTLVVSSSTDAQYVAAAGGATDATTSVFNIKSTGGAATISELKFTVTSAADSVTAVKVGSVSAPVVGGVAYLTGLNLAVPNGGSGLNQPVTISYANVGTTGIASGTTANVSLGYIKYNSGNSTQTLCHASYGACGVVLGTLVAGNQMTLVGSKPVLTVVDSSNQLVTGTVKVGSVTVAADAKGNIRLETLPVTINSTGTPTIASATNNIIVRNASTNALIASTNDNLTVAAGLSDSSIITFTGGYEITGGSSITFDIYVPAATVTGSAGDASLSMSLGAAASLTWTDLAGSGSTGAGAGTLIYNYPTNTSVITN